MMEKTITAYDEAGNRFVKSVRLLSLSKGTVVTFGWPSEYYVETLMNRYPLTQDLCIDGMGRNHKGYPVFISKDDVNEILKEIKELS